LLATQDLNASMSTFLKMAGGGAGDDEINLEAFLEQAETYETGGDLADRVWQVINTAFKTHPFGTVRAAELQRWVKSGAYDAILNGDYPRRGEQGKLSDDYVDAAGYYGNQAREAMSQVGDVLARARDAFNNAFKSSDS
jgi:hypothetical protein